MCTSKSGRRASPARCRPKFCRCWRGKVGRGYVPEEKQKEIQKPAKGNAALGSVVAVAGWLVPGLGHLLLRRWGRAAVYFLAVGTLAVTGLVLRGNIFTAGSGDDFDMLGFLADVGAGVFYFVARMVENGGPDVSR